MKHQDAEPIEQLYRALIVRFPINRLTTAITGLSILIGLFLGISRASAQADIRFTTTQARITVPVNSGNSTTITNFINLQNGATNAIFDVAGLPAGATAVLTDTNFNPLLSTTM